MSYRYKQTEESLWTVGMDVGGKWEPESDHGSEHEAAARVRYLNGGEMPEDEPDEQIVQMMNGPVFNGAAAIFCLTDKGRIFARLSGYQEEVEWLQVDLPDFDKWPKGARKQP